MNEPRIEAEKMVAFLDDVRDSPPGWVLWRSYDEAVAWMSEHGCPGFISLDHDLGWYETAEPSERDAKSGLDLVRWMIARDSDGTFFPKGFAFTVHSMNPVGRARMLVEFGDYLERRRAGGSL